MRFEPLRAPRPWSKTPRSFNKIAISCTALRRTWAIPSDGMTWRRVVRGPARPPAPLPTLPSAGDEPSAEPPARYRIFASSDDAPGRSRWEVPRESMASPLGQTFCSVRGHNGRSKPSDENNC